MTCPFSNKDSSRSNILFPKCPFTNTDKSFLSSQPISTKNETKVSEDEVISDDDINHSGCPVMNKRKNLITLAKQDPINKHFESHYEINYHREMDFLFLFQGGLAEREFNMKTEKLRNLPKHLKYTLLNDNPLMRSVQKKEFPEAYFAFNELKEKGNRLFKRKKYREAIDYYYQVINK